MKFGDTIRLEMLDADGRTIFGAIHQQVSERRTESEFGRTRK
jgi:fumarylacetoacetate (FAA) hydrolase